MRPGLVNTWSNRNPWRERMGRDDVLIFDTETTGLDGAAEIVELSIIDTAGNVLYDELVMPKGNIPVAASRVHGIDRDMLQAAGARSWHDHHSEVMRILRSAKTLLAYNIDYDVRLLRQTIDQHTLPAAQLPEQDCVMRAYAEHRREPGARGGYRWHKLQDALEHEGVHVQGQAHRALADCLATLEIARVLAQ